MPSSAQGKLREAAPGYHEFPTPDKIAIAPTKLIEVIAVLEPAFWTRQRLQAAIRSDGTTVKVIAARPAG